MYEAPHWDTPMRELIYDIRRRHRRRAHAEGRDARRLVVPVMTPDDIDTPLDADSLGEIGYVLRRGVVTSMDDR